jgi:hypothetical protein
MADAVSITKLQDGPKKAAFYLTNLSDGTGESAVKKIDMSTLATNAEGTAVTSVSISKVTFSTVGMTQRQTLLLWVYPLTIRIR